MTKKMKVLLVFLLIYLLQTGVFSIIPLSEGIHSIFPRMAETKHPGENCTRSSECVSEAICESTCRCKTTHVPIEDQCWKKVEPGKVGCTYDEQCEGVWPMSKCENGQCKCRENEIIVETKEGNICVVPGNCPTNIVSGALYDRATHRVSTCLTFSSKKGNNEFIGCDEYPEVYDCIAGICCPTRGLTCIQPMNEGEGDDMKQIRWFYNSLVGHCQSFEYRGTGGNSNNFITINQCESYCANRCPRGDPLIFSISDDESYDSENYQCKHDSNDQMVCCPTPSFICSNLGGVHIDKTTHRPYSNGSPRKGADVLARWYWDRSSLTCKPFKFYGQGGNFNNFVSKEECSNFCAVGLCPLGFPLLDPSENLQRCSAIEFCPETHECRNKICCPKPVTICSQNLRQVENCDSKSESTTKWTYSVEHSLCKSVKMNGCLIGDNQFQSFEKCHTTCGKVQIEPKCPIGKALKTSQNSFQRCSTSKPCPSNYECVYSGNMHTCCPSKEFACKQPISIGTSCSVATSQKWYYDSNTNKCIQFEYLGCNSNDNIFATRIDCIESCHRSECPDGGDSLVDSTNGKTISCSKNDDCPSTHICSRMLFMNVTSCCPSRKWICSQDADEGVSCGTPSKRFYFDPKTETCRQFNYAGCSGNTNSFSTRSACYQFCQSASCGSSEVVYHPSNLDKSFDCTLKSCPKSFSCVKHVWDENKNVCCGTPNFGVCSSLQHPILEYSTQQPMKCTPNVQNSCPLGFQCAYSSIRSLYFCCRDVEKIDKCPKGSRPEVWQPTAEPRFCSRNSQCASATSCYTPIVYMSGLCCASVDDVCPPTFIYDGDVDEDMNNRSQGECSPLERNSCGPDGQSVCLYSEAKSKFVCCRREARQINALEKCPPGSIMELAKTYCDPEHSCPITHFCMKKSSDRRGICCRHPSLKRANPVRNRLNVGRLSMKLNQCPKNEKIYRSGGLIQKCKSDNDCPEFYSCTSQRLGGSVCCGHDISEICPTKVYPTRKVERCSQCGVGYECHRHYCCPQKELVCSQPSPNELKDDESADSDDSDDKNYKNNEGPKRFYFDYQTNNCRSFIYSGEMKNDNDRAPQNHFADHESCIEMCVVVQEYDARISCPEPYINPPDHPQLCSPDRKSCSSSESCVGTSLNGTFVCCNRPPSLQVLMHNLCGGGHLPYLDNTGNTVRCSSNGRCLTKICRKSPVLRHSICCRKGPNLAKRRRIFSPLSDGDEPPKKVCDSFMEPDDGSCLPKLFPGGINCEIDEQCVSSICELGRCTCPAGTVQFRRMCASVCPIFYKNENGICV